MLQLMADAVRRWGCPEVLYVDNGSTYRGDTLSLFCLRLGIKLVHAQPYDPQARGKMERYWRTLREGCIDHLPVDVELHDVQVRLLAFVDRAYHIEAHSSLLGETPAQRWATRPELRQVTERELVEALTVQVLRRVSNTGTLRIAGIDWELEKGFLAGRKVHVFRSLLDISTPPWVEWDGKRLPLHRLDHQKNGSKKREPLNPSKHRIDKIAFDPVQPLINQLVGRSVKKGGKQ